MRRGVRFQAARAAASHVVAVALLAGLAAGCSPELRVLSPQNRSTYLIGEPVRLSAWVKDWCGRGTDLPDEPETVGVGCTDGAAPDDLVVTLNGTGIAAVPSFTGEVSGDLTFATVPGWNSLALTLLRSKEGALEQTTVFASFEVVNTVTGSGGDTDADAGADTDTDPGGDTDTDPGEDTDTDPGGDTDTDMETDGPSDTDTDA